ncbi:hypothetical protein [Escherichia phage PH1062]|nr:hypothetical protein [Escherichia phage PH1062]
MKVITNINTNGLASALHFNNMYLKQEPLNWGFFTPCNLV